MIGYLILEKKYLKRYRTNGIEENPNKMGFLDFLREMKNNAQDLPRYSKYCVTGIDDLLFMTDQGKRQGVARDIRHQLVSVAQTLQNKLIDVQIVCKGKLVRGDSLWLRYREERLPIDIIFGDIRKTEDSNGNEYYAANFNLTSG